MTTARPPGPRRHRALFWSAVVAAVGLVVCGATLAVVGYAATSGADGAVRGYFDALTRGDAPAALAFGDVPPGPHDLLTSTVLGEQRRLAPLTDVRIGAGKRTGDTTVFTVDYTLKFADDPQRVTDTVSVRKRGDDWKLTRVAVATALQMTQASQRASILGAAIPRGTTLLFPGALPVSYDTPYLQLKALADTVAFSTGVTTLVVTQISDRGRRATLDALAAALRGCLSRAANPRCPQPGERVVPGTLRGTLAAPVDDRLSVDVGDDASGRLDVVGSVAAKATYRELDFDNRPVTRTGTVDLAVHAAAYPVAPVRITWLAAS